MREVHRSIDVNRTPEHCYRLWHHFEQLPLFMRHVRTVQRNPEEDTWHWVANGPMGTPMEWDTELIIDRPNSEIAWHSTRESLVETSGHVWFVPFNENHTRLEFQLTYKTNTPMGEQLGAIFADPEKWVEEDLQRFKLFAEQQPARI